MIIHHHGACSRTRPLVEIYIGSCAASQCDDVDVPDEVLYRHLIDREGVGYQSNSYWNIIHVSQLRECVAYGYHWEVPRARLNNVLARFVQIILNSSACRDPSRDDDKKPISKSP